MTLELEVSKKEKSADAVRAAGSIPAVVYGPKQEPISVSVDKSAFEKTLREAGESTIINLKGLDSEIDVLIHEVAFNAARGGVDHVDFYAIEKGKKLTTNVALEFTGTAPVEKGGSSVTKTLHEIEITCLPADLPSHIDVDLSSLVDEESVIRVKDLLIPATIEVHTDPEAAVAIVSAAREEEPEEQTEVDMSAVEVEKKGKEESEESDTDQKE